MNPKNLILRYTVIKLSKDQERILKVARRVVMFKEDPIRLSEEFLAEKNTGQKGVKLHV